MSINLNSKFTKKKNKILAMLLSPKGLFVAKGTCRSPFCRRPPVAVVSRIPEAITYEYCSKRCRHIVTESFFSRLRTVICRNTSCGKVIITRWHEKVCCSQECTEEMKERESIAQVREVMEMNTITTRQMQWLSPEKFSARVDAGSYDNSHKKMKRFIEMSAR